MKKITIALSLICVAASSLQAQSKFKSRQDSLEFEAAKTEVWNPIPKAVTPGNNFSDAPSDAIVLYNGSNLDAFQKRKGGMPGWKIESDGALTVVKGSGDLETKEAFGDCQFHLEFREPAVIAGSNQTRGKKCNRFNVHGNFSEKLNEFLCISETCTFTQSLLELNS